MPTAQSEQGGDRDHDDEQRRGGLDPGRGVAADGQAGEANPATVPQASPALSQGFSKTIR